MEAETQGWLAVCFNDLGFGMVGADVKLGYNNGTDYVVLDRYAYQYEIPNSDGTGSDDVIESNGTRDATKTLFEFYFPMIPQNPDDVGENGIAKDHKLEVNGSYSLLIAWAEDNSFGTRHDKKYTYSMFIAPESVTGREATNIQANYGGISSATQEDTISVTVTLTDSTNAPIEGQTVSMYMKTLISELNLNSSVTDANGVATIVFNIDQQYESEISLYAKYMGDLTYKRTSSDDYTISFFGQEDIHDPLPNEWRIIPKDLDYLVPYMTGFGSLAVVGFIWVCFAYVIYTVLWLNRKEGKTGGE
jgi:hypothetical protein